MCRITAIAFIIVGFNINYLHGARILGIVSIPSYSHQIVFQPLWRELSLRGHQLVVITTDPIKDKTLTNLTEIDLSNSYSFSKDTNLGDTEEKPIYQMMNDLIMYVKEIGDFQLSHPDVQNLIKDEKQHFDLLLVESFIAATHAFSERFKCPYIIISSFDIPNYIHEHVGNPTSPIMYPDVWFPYVGKMSFVERVLSFTYFVFFQLYYRGKLIDTNEDLINKYFGYDYPCIDDIHKKVSMIFVNTEPILHPIRPLVPAVIQIGGGMHLKQPKPLPFELQRLLDNGTTKFIYFSLGTNIKSQHLRTNLRRVILETFAELPYKVLWKFEADELEEKPDNVFISKWFPQQEIFRHPKIKLFITQGGIQSVEEAICSKIPIVVMPFTSDQPFNARRIVNKGIGLSIDHRTLDKTAFKSTILEVINNPKYRKNVEQLALLFKDQQTTGLERAVWWTEYVLRYKGAQYFQGPAVNVPIYQQYMVDILAVSLLILIASLILIVFAIKQLIKITKYLTMNTKTKIN